MPPQAVASTAYNAANHQTTFGDKTLTYDNNGNLQTLTDPSGTTTYTWNARNQLVGISGPGVNATFVYDGFGRREKKTINGSLTEFLYDGVNPVQETAGATILANIFPGLGIDDFLNRTDVVAGTTSNFLTDALGSPVAVTDNAGVVQTEYTYEPFGKTAFSGNSNSSSYQYTSRENDGTGLYSYRNRYYQSQLQRFVSEDPIEFGGGQINLYNYVNNSPLNFVDAHGYFMQVLGGIAGGAAAGFIAGGTVGAISTGLAEASTGGSFVEGVIGGFWSGAISGALAGAIVGGSVATAGLSSSAIAMSEFQGTSLFGAGFSKAMALTDSSFLGWNPFNMGSLAGMFGSILGPPQTALGAGTSGRKK